VAAHHVEPHRSRAVVLAGAEHRDDVAGAVGGGEGREGRADEEKEGGEDPARVGGGAPASGHSGGPVVAGAGSGQSRRAIPDHNTRTTKSILLTLGS